MGDWDGSGKTQECKNWRRLNFCAYKRTTYRCKKIFEKKDVQSNYNDIFKESEVLKLLSIKYFT